MKIMAALLRQQRAPAEIMGLWANEPRLQAVPGGAPCPCGSKRSVESCHRPPESFTPPGHSQPVPHKLPAGKKHRHA
jgi:hypothetical protein